MHPNWELQRTTIFDLKTFEACPVLSRQLQAHFVKGCPSDILSKCSLDDRIQVLSLFKIMSICFKTLHIVLMRIIDNDKACTCVYCVFTVSCRGSENLSKTHCAETSDIKNSRFFMRNNFLLGDMIAHLLPRGRMRGRNVYE